MRNLLRFYICQCFKVWSRVCFSITGFIFCLFQNIPVRILFRIGQLKYYCKIQTATFIRMHSTNDQLQTSTQNWTSVHTSGGLPHFFVSDFCCQRTRFLHIQSKHRHILILQSHMNLYTFPFLLQKSQHATHIFLYLSNSSSSDFFFRNFLAILVDFHMNYTINLSSFQKKRSWYFYQEHVKFIIKLREDQHLNDINSFYLCLSICSSSTIFYGLQKYFKVFFMEVLCVFLISQA